MKRSLLPLHFLAGITLGVPAFVSAAETTVQPIMDAAVSEANPDRNYGSSDLMVGGTSGQTWESFLRFDLSGIPVNAEITAAELRLQAPNLGSGGTLRVSRPDAGWAEAEATWSNRPSATTLDNIGLTVEDQNNAHLTLTAPVLSHLQDVVSSVTPDCGLKLSFPSATAEQHLTPHSRESGSPPQLVITYTPGPELPDFTANLSALDDRLRAELFPTPEDAATPFELVWNTKPGVRYRLWESPDLADWTVVSGYPAEADALGAVQEVSLEPGGKFFKVEALDEQAPEVVSRFPEDGDFGIRRYYAAEEIGIQLTDATGIDPASISLDLDGIGTFTAADSELALEDDLLTLDLGGDTAMGAFGATVAASLTVADPIGNSATYDWSFALETEVVLADGLFTFGSPDAQRAGQRVPPIPTRILAERAGGGGPVRMNDSEWTLEEVNADSLVIDYTGASAPVFTIDQYLTNMTPAHLDEIFYRKVTSIADDPVAKRLTLGTVDVPAWEIVTEASVSLSEDDIAFEADADGRIIRAYQLKSSSGSKEFSIQPLQIDWSDKEIMGLYENASGSTQAVFGLPIDDRPPQYDEEWDCKLKLKQAILRLRPSFSISVETRRFYLGFNKLHSECTLEVDEVLEPEFEFIVPSIDYDFDLDNAVNKEPLIKWDFPILIGTTGIWVTVSPRLRAEASMTAGLTGTVSFGASGGYSQTMVIDYDKDNDPRLDIAARDGHSYFDLIEPQIALGGTLGAEFKLKPEIDVKVNSLAGFYVNFDPALGADLNANLNNGTLVEADLGVTFNGHVNAGMSVLGVSNSFLPSFEPWELFTWEKRWAYPEAAPEDPLAILIQPRDRTVEPGANITLEVQANHTNGVSYEWRQDGRRLYNDSPVLRLDNVTAGAAGDYQVTLSRVGSEPVNSEVATVTMGSGGGPAPAGFVEIPAGNFQMGDSFDEGDSDERPVHKVNVSRFYMQSTEVTNAQMAEVMNWAYAEGLVTASTNSVRNVNGSQQELLQMDDPDIRLSWSGSEILVDAGYESHPAVEMTWYGAVSYCQFRSQMDGLTPCYDFSDWSCDFAASGYRLPTEAEWEKAARLAAANAGETWRYPFGNSVDSTKANYNLNNGGTQDVASYPATAGLHDIAGNVYEWCHDWYGSSYYSSSPGSDPPGPASGSKRVIRGGSWYSPANSPANSCRVAYRVKIDPGHSHQGWGFRPVRR